MSRCCVRSWKLIHRSPGIFEPFMALAIDSSGMKIHDKYPEGIVHRRDSAVKIKERAYLYSARMKGRLE
jgi:hypothetical protein